MRTLRIATIGGDGIGPEVLAAGLEVLAAIAAKGGPQSEVTQHPWGSAHYLRHGRMMGEGWERLLEGQDAVLLGAVGDPRVSDHIAVRDLVIRIRQAFDLYVNLRPVRLFQGVESPLRAATPKSLDILFVRENSEGEYVGAGGRMHAGTEREAAVETAYFSRQGIERVARYAFRLAQQRGRRLCSITKSNALRHGMTLWDECVQRVAGEFPDVEWEQLLVDAACVHLVRDPARFGVVVASNLFGDILTDLGAALAGGLGLAPSANLDPEGRHPSMFEPVHGSAPDIAGRGVANPLAMFWSIALMLDQLGEADWGASLLGAVEAVLAHGHVRTPDLGGRAGTDEMTREVIAALQPRT